jgi:hypothetical protein
MITYTKGQKSLFMQSHLITQKKMYCFMIPVLFLSTAMAIFAPIIQDYSWSGGLISGLNVVVTFFVTMINYMKFESKSEKYLQLSNQYDRIEMSLEMTSNKLIYMDNTKEKNEIVLNKLKELEITMNELKDVYDLSLPQEISRLYPVIGNINIFSLIKKMESYRRVLIFKFRDVKNEINYILHKWKQDTEMNPSSEKKEKDRLFFLYEIKEKIKTELLEFINIYQYVDELFSKDIKIANENHGFIYLYCKYPRKIKKDDIHPLLHRYFTILFDDL